MVRGIYRMLTTVLSVPYCTRTESPRHSISARGEVEILGRIRDSDAAEICRNLRVLEEPRPGSTLH